MNLTMDFTIIELSFHARNFVLKVLDREEPGAGVWPKLCQNYYQNCHFSKTALLHNFRTYTFIYFSDPIIKISREKFGLSRFVEFLLQTLHASQRPCKMEFRA